nr:phosphatidate cytidylyltransferase [uncultured Gellertiella sp.]
MTQELRLRIQSGIVMAVGVLVATWLGGTVFRLLAALIQILVFYEWTAMARLKDGDRAGFILAWVAQLTLAATILFGYLHLSAALLFAMVLAAIAYTAVTKGSEWLAGGTLYAGLTGVSLAFIRGGDLSGLKAILVIFAVVWSTDILAYFVGRAIGGAKLAPRISPGKTWSGAIGGTIAGVCGGFVVVAQSGGTVTTGTLVILLLLSIFSQIGDLFESFIKRRFGVKDSSHLIPGHGGVMDRVDGLVFACFAAFLLSAAATVFSSCTQCSVATVLLGIGPN